NHTLPVASNASTTSSYLSSGARTNCSWEQMMPLSNDAPITIFSAASLRLASSSIMTGTLPAPTPNEGRPEEYADLTIAPPPVATTTSTTFINSCVDSIEPFLTI